MVFSDIIKRIFIFLLIISCSKEVTRPPQAISIKTIDTYHGQKIEDPYRNLENLEDSTVINWLKQQGTYAFNTLNSIPGKKSLIDKQLSYDTNTEFSIRFVRVVDNGSYFYTKSIGTKSIAKLYYRQNLESDEILLYDPTSYSDNDEYHINYLQPDWNGKKVAVSLSKKGEEASEILIIEVETKKVLPDVIKNSNPSFGGVQWLSDNSGFIYLHIPDVDPTDKDYWLNTKSVLHIVGSDSKVLTDVFSKLSYPELDINPEDFPIVYNYNKNDGYLFSIVGGVNSFYDKYYIKESSVLSKNAKWKLLHKESDKVKKILIEGNDFIFLSAKNASNFQICRTSIESPNFDNPEIIVPEKKDKIITNFVLAEKGIYFTTKKNGVEAKLHSLIGIEEKEIKLPKPIGDIHITATGINNDLIRISTIGYLTPTTNYLFDINTNQFQTETLLPVNQYPDFEDIAVEEIEIPSHDGVMVPVSVIYQKGIKKNGSNPTLFFGYGSYGGGGSVRFNSSFLTWVVEGGILVFAHVRGGGQKGVAWHKAGQKTTKPNTWKDMIATTEYMIKEGFTSPEKSAIWGSSAGGILAGRAMTERPELYKAVILTSPAMNMLRSEIQPNGQNSIKEFGTVEIKEEFEALLEMDSYHHIKEGVEYPATLVTGGMKDGRVVIWDPAKFVARLQASNAADTPVLFGVKFEDGHAAMNSTKMDRYEMYVNAFSFALWQMGYPEYQPK
ncbi:prolyl oligopeptidase family serine peptidase [Aquimarina sp. MMG016]|uniref:prolyl oligopeptidase family serine peptidase n=1 Tax=Aquimarina sp. MMG016 TaxID=2822690 RepID=UPI001B3A460F|nr:prolyl oligopeptidase family serine peptidase [Aquimarina sp. MMG016]MBQ4818851.1 prolyl oligopeptidase family serine peptidase [Aquimarina sp. MMG016]